MGRLGNKPDKHRKNADRDRLEVQKQIYHEVQREFRFHDDANTSLDKKAQNLMIASALVATLFLHVAMADDLGGSPWNMWWLLGVIAFLAFIFAAIVLCIWVNHPQPQPVSIAGGSLLCCDRLDDRKYGELIAGGEESY